MAGNLNLALALAQSYTWEQSHGYDWLYVDNMGHPDFDCSGFVGRCLNEAGFNYPAFHVGTWDMTSLGANRLVLAGFTEIRHTTANPVTLQHGDIVVLNHPYGQGGHCFFYAENIFAYTDPNADSDNTAICSRAKIEASSDRGEEQTGDHRKNGTGAFWEVWTHNFYDPYYSGYDPSDPSDYIFVYRLNTIDYIGAIGGLIMSLPAFIKDRRKRRKW